MEAVNLIIVVDQTRENVLMCKRRKDPYKGLYNFVGGKREKGETPLMAAYRELYEESGFTSDDLSLIHLMNFTYLVDECVVEVFLGFLQTDKQPYGDENELLWMKRSENFFDDRFAGEGNIGHMMKHVEFYEKKK